MNPWNENPTYASVMGMIFSNVILLLAVIGLALECALLAGEMKTLLHNW